MNRRLFLRVLTAGLGIAAAPDPLRKYFFFGRSAGIYTKDDYLTEAGLELAYGNAPTNYRQITLMMFPNATAILNQMIERLEPLA